MIEMIFGNIKPSPLMIFDDSSCPFLSTDRQGKGQISKAGSNVNFDLELLNFQYSGVAGFGRLTLAGTAVY